MDKKLLEDMDMGSKSPGPAAYSIKPTLGKLATDPTIEKNPAYSILGRKMFKVNAIGPGPAHDTTKLNRYGKDRTPGGRIGERLLGLRKAVTPGPLDYCVRSPGVTGGYRMRPDVGYKQGPRPWPGPNAYALPSTLDRRAARIGELLRPGLKCPTPGPADYVVPAAELYMPGTFRVGRTMGHRLAGPRKPITPGPADYDGLARADCCNRCTVKNQVCRTTFGMRISRKVPPFAVRADNERDDDCC